MAWSHGAVLGTERCPGIAGGPGALVGQGGGVNRHKSTVGHPEGHRGMEPSWCITAVRGT